MTCEANPPAPAGYGVWLGRVPQPLTDWAIGIRNTIAKPPYGTTWEKAYNGQVVVARKDHHTFTYRDGQLVSGICIPGVTLYAPKTKSGLVGVSDQLGDPLATPDSAMALFNDTNASSGTNWTAVAVSGVALVAVVGAFVAAIRYAGRR